MTYAAESLPSEPGPEFNRRSRVRLRMGALWIDAFTFAEALDEIESLVASRAGGAVYTPNVDHVVTAARDHEYAAVYRRASLTLVDGQALVWASRLLGERLPERVSGSDLLMPLMERAAAREWRVYILGGAPGVAEEAMAAVTQRFPVNFVGHHSPVVSMDSEPDEEAAIAAHIGSAKPDVVLVALGAPKQELLIDRIIDRIRPAVAIGVGAAIDFAAGRIRRAPAWISDAGFEWLYRLFREPRRLWRRYLVEDRAILRILLRTLQSPPEERVYRSPTPGRSEAA